MYLIGPRPAMLRDSSRRKTIFIESLDYVDYILPEYVKRQRLEKERLGGYIRYSLIAGSRQVLTSRSRPPLNNH